MVKLRPSCAIRAWRRDTLWSVRLSGTFTSALAPTPIIAPAFCRAVLVKLSSIGSPPGPRPVRRRTDSATLVSPGGAPATEVGAEAPASRLGGDSRTGAAGVDSQPPAGLGWRRASV